MVDNREISIYIHIPICERKCNYCAFLSFVGGELDEDEYFELLQYEIASYEDICKDKYVKSIFIGGGTPSIAKSEHIRNLLKWIQMKFNVLANCEITIEINPNSIEKEKLRVYKVAGVNRISMGVQSFCDDELKCLGRIHSKDEAVRAFHTLREMDFDNINIDLIYDIPGQSVDSWVLTLSSALQLQPEHISAYSVEIEENTDFYKKYKLGEIDVADEDKLKSLYDITVSTLSNAGYNLYELSNFSKSNYECRHNEAYWKYGQYIGLGMSGSSFFCGKRWENPRDIEKYRKFAQCDKKKHIADVKELTVREEMGIFIFTALRRADGVSIDEFNDIFNEDFSIIFKNEIDYIRRNYGEYVEYDGKILRIKNEGFFYSNDIMCEFT